MFFDKLLLMQQDTRFSGADANVVIHATEDQARIMAAIAEILGVPSDRFSGVPTEGHHKNRILMLTAQLSSEEANELASRIASGLNSLDREELWQNIDLLSDEKGNLYLRLDKQRLCQGKISITSGDSLRIRFRPVKRYRPARSLEDYRGLFTSG